MIIYERPSVASGDHFSKPFKGGSKGQKFVANKIPTRNKPLILKFKVIICGIYRGVKNQWFNK